MNYLTEELQKLEDIYDKAVMRGDEDIADRALQLSSEIQQKIVEQNP